MEQLETKYRQNNLTQEELLELRRLVNGSSDAEIERSLYKNWENTSFDEKNIPTERLDMIKEKIDEAITPNYLFTLLRRITQVAAAVLIPLFMFTTLYFYKESRTISAEEMVVSASKGERANITLPDGTKVAINSESFLTYSPQNYNKSERRINFEGEAFFDVAKKESVPFIINTKDLAVKVLGTKFNLLARKKNETIELVLEEGHVLLSSSKEEKELFANQKATLDRLTGTIRISSESIPKMASAWKAGELIFGNARLKDVLKALESSYGVIIHIASSPDINNDLFSGTITTGNLLEALEIIKHSYHLNYTVVGNEVNFFED